MEYQKILAALDGRNVTDIDRIITLHQSPACFASVPPKCVCDAEFVIYSTIISMLYQIGMPPQLTN